MRVLVIGARPNSLGMAVVRELEGLDSGAITAGITGEEYDLDILEAPMWRIRNVLRSAEPDHVVCTAGINTPETVGRDPSEWYQKHFDTNVIGPMRLLHGFAAWITEERLDGDEYSGGDYLRHFVAISSNSASIPRTNSAAYCASKAALSQALRVKAREAQGGDHGFIVYGYEPGWLADTPMSHNIENTFGAGKTMHRMRGKALADGVSTMALAQQIVAGLQVPGAALNGATIRYDGGEGGF